MILLDTHIWLWWVGADPRLTPERVATLKAAEAEGLLVSAISCWEIAHKAAAGKLDLGRPAHAWITEALTAPNIRVEPITASIAVEAALLPGEFHKDPADRLIVATARKLDVQLLTMDAKVQAYPHVKHV